MPTLLCLIASLAAAASVETPGSCEQASAMTAPQAVVQVIPAEEAATASTFHSATRLRKLHLVRPDLIPYPLAYEVYC